VRDEYWPLFVAALDAQHPAVDDDPFRGTVQVACISYEALPLIGLAAMHAAGQSGTPQKPVGPCTRPFDTEDFFRFEGSFRGCDMTVMQMKALQSAWAVRRIERMWRLAWDEARRRGP
jgi:hypothetical protein